MEKQQANKLVIFVLLTSFLALVLSHKGKPRKSDSSEEMKECFNDGRSYCNVMGGMCLNECPPGYEFGVKCNGLCSYSYCKCCYNASSPLLPCERLQEIQVQLLALNETMQEVKTETQEGREMILQEIQEVETEVQNLETEVQGMQTNLQQEIQEVITEVQNVQANLQQEIQEVKSDLEMIKTEAEEEREMLRQVRVMVKTVFRPRHCKDLLDSGDSDSGLRHVYPYLLRPDYPVTVYCEQDIDGGGWTVFQRRDNISSRENFYRNWAQYKAGFGDVNSEFWLGLNYLYEMTKADQELRIDLQNYEGDQRWAKYGTFRVDSEDTNYLLTIGDYIGNAGDSMAYHNGRQFSTYDVENHVSSYNCAEAWRGGWWYRNCHRANLNGYQHVGAGSPGSEGITWYLWLGHEYSLMRTTMMIRPAI